MLVRARSAAEYFQDAGSYFRGRRFICARSLGGVYGLVAWGRLSEEDAQELTSVLDAAAKLDERRRQLVDLRLVQHVAGAAMACLTHYYASRPEYAATVEREAVVRPDGLVGIFAEGLYRVVPLPFDGRVFRYLDDAFRWLDEPAGWSPAVERVLEQEAHNEDPLIEELREAVLVGGMNVSVGEAARRCALSSRSFQRRLAAMETTWPRLRRSLLVDEAQRRMLDGAQDLKFLAHDLGFRSPARLSEAFRAVSGMSPSEWYRRTQSQAHIEDAG